MRPHTRSDVSLVCAPYSPVGSGEIVHLGAARKIELVVSAIFRAAGRIILVNSAHNDRRFARASVRRRKIGLVTVAEVTPPLFPNRKIGKLLNTFWAFCFALRLGNRNVKIFWSYNAYIFEAILAASAKVSAALKVVELEDWPGSRRGRFSIKNWLDRWGLNRSVLWADTVYVVNEAVGFSARAAGAKRVIALPGLVNEVISPRASPRAAETRTVIGYCGGLSVEKGCDVLLQLVRRLPASYQLKVAGFGPLTSAFQEMAQANASLIFLGALSQDELEEFMRSCDVLINPHSDISAMRSGIFPFKVIDYLSSGALVISTRLPHVDSVINDAVIEIEANPESIVRAISAAESGSKELARRIISAQSVIEERYSVTGLERQLRDHLMESNQGRTIYV